MKELKIRKDRTSVVLRKLAKVETDGRVARRLLAIANALTGMSRVAAAESAGMDRQTLRARLSGIGSSATTSTASTGSATVGKAAVRRS